MEVIDKSAMLFCLSLTSCATVQTLEQRISDLYIADFQTENMDECSPLDVDLNNHEARQFFLRARRVEYKIIHDHYNVAPCYLEGILKFDGGVCDWTIQASAIGSISCNDEVSYYACDTCDDLFDNGSSE